MEYRPDNCKYYSQSEFNNNIFRHRNKFERMFRYSFSNSFSGFNSKCCCDCISFNDLLWRIFNANREWCNILSMEYRADYGKYYGESDINDNLYGYRN
jgi:hypothetical protein